MILINGQAGDHIDVTDRGLHYGDGLFETIAVDEGKPRLWALHMARLTDGCERLGIPVPDSALLESEAKQLCADTDRAVLKIIITRSSGGRGYRAPESVRPTRIVALYPWPEQANDAIPFNLRLCRTPLGCNPALAGIKHLNRLEQIIARREWSDDSFHEGVMCDAQGNVIECISANLFFVYDGRLLTPDVSRCGVAGVMREKVLVLAKEMSIPSEITIIHRDEMARMDEVFITNAILGIRDVARYEQTQYTTCKVTRMLQQKLEAAR